MKERARDRYWVLELLTSVARAGSRIPVQLQDSALCCEW